MSDLRNVSDTALLVAHYRALESERPDALFRDPWAAKLSGERGRKIVENLPAGLYRSWALVVRTVVMDRWISELIGANKIDAVLNLAAGLDTRPYRLNMGGFEKIHWYEVDLPEMIEFKANLLRDDKPICKLERISCDLVQEETRKEIFRKIGLHEKVLVITEGLLVYLEKSNVVSLAQALASEQSYRFWMMDLNSPGDVKQIRSHWGNAFGKANAYLQFAPEEGPAFFSKYGWKPLEVLSNQAEGKKLNRQMQNIWFRKNILSLFSENHRNVFRNPTNLVLLGR